MTEFENPVDGLPPTNDAELVDHDAADCSPRSIHKLEMEPLPINLITPANATLNIKWFSHIYKATNRVAPI